VSSYDLLLKLLLRHKCYNHSSSLLKLLLIITLTNTSNTTKTKQIKHIKNKAIIIVKAFKKVLKAAVTLKVITVFREIKTTADIIY
jgi:RNase P/RNase MRP subunit p30